MPDWVRKKISKIHKGKPKSEYQIECIIKSNQNRIIKESTKIKIANGNRGKKVTKESIAKRLLVIEKRKLEGWVSPKRGRKLTEVQKQKRRKSYRLIYGNGNVIIVDNLKKWCTENNFKHGGLLKALDKNRFYKGLFKVESVDNKYKGDKK